MSKKKDTYQHGFSTPKGYFENLEDRCIENLGSSKFSENNGFKVPDGYFEALETRLFNAATTAKEPPKLISLFRNNYVRYTAAIAASIVLMISIVNNNTSATGAIEDIALASITEYIEQENIEFDTYDVVALLQEDEMSNLNTQHQYFSDETLESYLLETLDDATLLTE